MPAASSASRIASTVRSLSSSPRSNLATVSIVCALSETSTPHRLGAALTYARRYALFTLVGLAGEDDIDAPDLAAPDPQKPPPEPASGHGMNRLNGNSYRSARLSSERIGATVRSPAPRVLEGNASVALGDRLVAEIDALVRVETATEWAQRSMAEKNRLLPADAHRVEGAFQRKLENLSAGSIDTVPARNGPRSGRTKD